MTEKGIQIVLRPRMLDKPLEIYDYEFSKYPDRIRVSFADGRTFVYDIRTEQPAPQIVESVKIIRKWNGYVNQPARRRRRK